MGHKRNLFTSWGGDGFQKSARSGPGWPDLVLVIAPSLLQVVSVMNERLKNPSDMGSAVHWEYLRLYCLFCHILSWRGERSHTVSFVSSLYYLSPLKPSGSWISDLSSQIQLVVKNPVRGHVFALMCQPSCLVCMYNTLTKIPSMGIFSFKEPDLNTKQFPWLSVKVREASSEKS